MKYVIFSDPTTGWVGSPIALVESNEEKLLELKQAGFVPRLVEDRVHPTQYRRSGGKRGGYCPVIEAD